jgi:hypothetical protein
MRRILFGINTIMGKKWVKRVLVVSVIILVGVLTYNFGRLQMGKNKSVQTFNTVDNSKIQVPVAKAQSDLNRDFSFQLASGKQTYKFTYTIESAQLVDQIIVQGQLAKAVAGKNFLILNLKVTNDNTQGIQINTRDFVRLSGGDTEWLAADVHNDPVEIQAISTKYTRLGFPVDENQKNFKLQIGEITGDKTIVDLNF